MDTLIPDTTRLASHASATGRAASGCANDLVGRTGRLGGQGPASDGDVTIVEPEPAYDDVAECRPILRLPGGRPRPGSRVSDQHATARRRTPLALKRRRGVPWFTTVSGNPSRSGTPPATRRIRVTRASVNLR